jgi:hypothetical protein
VQVGDSDLWLRRPSSATVWGAARRRHNREGNGMSYDVEVRRPIWKNMWVWAGVSLAILLITNAISNATGTPGNGNDTGVAELMNTIGFAFLFLIPVFVVAAIVQTVRGRRS